ncbi:MAG: signal peptidase II, partial [Syntrophobacteraceae bacterium]
TIGAAVFIGLVVVVLLFSSGLPLLAVLGLSLFCGGSLGNLLNRATYEGTVVDFINVGWGRLSPFIFNVADVAIVLGTGLFLLGMAAWCGRTIFGKRSR